VKNQLFLVEVARELRRRGKNIRILCAGSGDEDYQARVQDAIRENGLEEHIRLLGVRRDIDVLMRKSAAFVLPSKYEGMPLVLIEAQASGLPCVSADTFSREVDFGIGTITWLPPEADAARWADAIEEAVSAGRADKAAVQRAVEEKGFDSDSFARKLCELYQNAPEGSKA
jgi:glycosyltransferase EpsF